jgi:hypothetical protein
LNISKKILKKRKMEEEFGDSDEFDLDLDTLELDEN